MADPAQYVYTNFSNGWIIEKVTSEEGPCVSYILLPAENLWSVGVRVFLYLLALSYLFVGVAFSSDTFMCSIEMITSMRRTIVKYDEERQETVEREVLVWNETVANLTLMALGSSAPEILLAVVETVAKLGVDTSDDDGLGTFTIIGSAAFNLLIITAICVVSVSSPDVKRIQEVGVFMLTSVWSIFAYLWMIIVLVGISPNEIEPWEAWLTMAFFPIMVLTAYCQDNHWWCSRHKTVGIAGASSPNVRVVMSTKTGMHGMSKELGVLEKEKNMRASRLSLRTLNEKEPEPEEKTKRPKTAKMGKVNHLKDGRDGDAESQMGSQVRIVKTVPAESSKGTFARARFRHATVRSMMGGRKHHVPKDQLLRKQSMADVVMAMRTTLQRGDGPTMPSDEELLGKFTFASPSYSVLESAGIMEIDILFHRLPPSKAAHLKLANGSVGGENETSFTTDPNQADSFMHKGVVSVEFETREGSAKIDKDFKYTSGSLVFTETEYRKSITIPIINDLQYEADVDFYVILKNPSGDAGISDPNITRVMIIDDDEPGEFQFEEPHYYADTTTGQIVANVIRQKGCDGVVSIEYSTIDGTAKGGTELGAGVDYIRAENVITFKHGETTKPLVIDVNKETKGSKNFIITLRNPSIGAKISDHSATVCNITSDNIAERLADVIDDNDEELTWGGQFRAALSLECEQDEDGNDIPLKWYDYLLHFISFFWKVILAFIPPRTCLGGAPAFLLSLFAIGIQTFLIEQVASLLSCVAGLKSAVAGITIVALGTSLPDTFASRTAALHDEGADAAIGNITGSNSVNVFLGLGLPWVIQSLYSTIRNQSFRVKTTNLTQSVIIFSIVGTICIFLLLLRRKIVGGELGGKNKVVKYLTGIFLILLWLIYIVLSSVKAYYPNALPW